MGFLRMALAASVMHEAGHILVYTLCTRTLPRLAPSLGGISLRMDKLLTRRQEAAVICAGPLVNFLAAAGMFLSAWHKASYGLYFFAAVHLCMGLYNLSLIHISPRFCLALWNFAMWKTTAWRSAC